MASEARAAAMSSSCASRMTSCWASRSNRTPSASAWNWSNDFVRFHLEVHPEKTRLLEFGPYAADHQRRRGLRKPETFNFLGFTHICGKKRSNGRFTVLRQTIRKRLQAKLQEVKTELRRRMHRPIREQGAWLRSVVAGHVRYYGVPMNGPALRTFRSPGRMALAPHASATRPASSLDLGANAAASQLLAAACTCLSSLSSPPTWRHHLRWEPDAGNPLVRICGGGAQ